TFRVHSYILTPDIVAGAKEDTKIVVHRPIGLAVACFVLMISAVVIGTLSLRDNSIKTKSSGKEISDDGGITSTTTTSGNGALTMTTYIAVTNNSYTNINNSNSDSASTVTETYITTTIPTNKVTGTVNSKTDRNNEVDSDPKQSDVKLVINEFMLPTNDLNNDVLYMKYEELDEGEKANMLIGFEEVIGVEYDEFISSIPDDYVLNSFKATLARVGTGDEFYVYNYVFDYKVGDVGDINIIVEASKKTLDEWNMTTNEKELSKINGVNAAVYYNEKTYRTLFSYKEINFDICLNNTSKESLNNLLTSIIKN
ncbi:MAG: hypothetical protein GX896_04530, partial [Clostridiales bacterium]|nr:hypothetical protein [Clostridiales bacterium]